jgi:hypothetical protein
MRIKSYRATRTNLVLSGIFFSVKLGVKYEGKQMAIDSVGEEGAAGNSLISRKGSKRILKKIT